MPNGTQDTRSPDEDKPKAQADRKPKVPKQARSDKAPELLKSSISKHRGGRIFTGTVTEAKRPASKHELLLRDAANKMRKAMK